MAVEIRRAEGKDAALLAKLNSHVHDAHVAAEPDVYRPTRAEEVAAWFGERLGGGDIVLLAHDGGEPLGYAMTQVVDKPGHLFAHGRRFLLLHHLAVATGARRRGVGRALMAAVEALAAELAVEAVELDVRGANTDALTFYATLGYRAAQLHLRRDIKR